MSEVNTVPVEKKSEDCGCGCSDCQKKKRDKIRNIVVVSVVVLGILIWFFTKFQKA